ncbi:DUF4296 domain-containing protein [Flavobacterium sp. N3904]|uniref:DUF4296 domain-containing protein n=1 Tax=Flavobacterium sp. N3904 TaxID=2986835 RepID=UPI002224C5A0|nr:DUF4296 domain-containing protein [Flavobacterium sp. N3904]
MKKSIFLFVLIVSFFGCNKDLVEKPDNLIDKKVMLDIMYDMSILDALKYQNPNSLYQNNINPKTYIYQKYKIDSLQFVKSNAYYAADYRGYKDMFDMLNKRLIENKKQVDSIIKIEQKKQNSLKKAKAKKVQDSIKKAKKALDLKLKKEKDSVAKAKKEKELKTKKEK